VFTVHINDITATANTVQKFTTDN